MNYEIVKLEEKTVVGVTARTNNTAPDMSMVIGRLWEQLYSKGVYEDIQNKCNHKALGIYTDYTGNEKDDYSVLAACEVEKAELLPNETVERTIPAGTYAKFILKGDMREVVVNFWQKLWSMDLKRSFLYDFEEYQNSDMENAEIHVYIGLKE